MDIASLGISIDTSDVAKATTDLDKIVQAGEKAEKAAEGVADGFGKATTAAADLATSEGKLAESTEDAKARLLDMAKASLEASEYHKSLTTSVTTSATAVDGAKKATVDWAAVQAEINARGQAILETETRLAEETKKAAAATGVQADGLQALLGKINPTVAALQKLDDQQAELSKYKAAGLIDGDGFKAYSADIDAARAKLKGFNDESGNSKTGLSALALNSKEARENVLQLGNALAEGNIRVAAHNILEIATNAGSSAIQLGKMLIPGAALVAVLGAIAYAYIDAEKEASAFNKAIYTGGGAAGVTAQQLQDIAKQAGVVTNNFAGARDAALALAASGKVTQSELANLTQAATAISTVTGEGAAEVAKSLSGLGDSASSAAAKISEQYGLITSQQYLAIKAIEDNGDAQKALDTLSADLNSDAQDRLKLYRASLSDIELGWEDIKNATTRAYAEVKGQLFPDLSKQIEIIQNVLDTRKSGGVAGALSNGLSSLNTALGLGTGDNDDSTAALESKLAGLKARQALSEQNALLTSENTTANKALISVQEDLDKQLDNVDPVSKREAALKKLNAQFTTLYENSAKTGKDSPLLDGVQFDGKSFSGGAYSKIVASINAQYKDPATKSGSVDLTGFNDAKNALAGILTDYQNSEKQLEAAQKAGLVSQSAYSTQRSALIEAEKEQVSAAHEAEISALEAARDKSTTTAAQRIELDQKIADAKANMVKAQKDADTQLEVLSTNETGRLAKEKRSVDSYVQALGEQQKALELAGQRAVVGVGRGDKENNLDSQLNSQQDRYAQQALELENQRSDPSRNMSDDEFAKKSQALADANKKATDQIRKNYSDVEDAQGDWTKGATAAWENYLDSAKDIAGQTKSLFTNAFSSMEDAIVNFVTTGKLSFSDFAKSVIADMARIAARQAATGLLSSGISAFGSLLGGSSVASTAGSSASDYTSSAFTSYVAGARATGGGVSPDSLYQVNELGPELYSQGGKSYLMTGANGGSVTPLTSSSSSALASSGASGGGVQVAISIASDGSTDVSSNQSGLQQFGTEIGKLVETKYKELEAKSLSSQGNIRKAINGRA